MSNAGTLRAQTPILEIVGLSTQFAGEDSVVTAVDDVSFTVCAGETFGIVGESGSGKSVTAYSILGLIDPPGEIVAGEIRYRERELRGVPERELRRIRGGKIAMIFQDPMTSLHPLLRLEDQMIDAIQGTGRRRAGWRAEAVSAAAQVIAAGRASAHLSAPALRRHAQRRHRHRNAEHAN